MKDESTKVVELYCAQQLLVLKTTLIPNQEDQRPILTPSKAGYPASMIDSDWFTVLYGTSTRHPLLDNQLFSGADVPRD